MSSNEITSRELFPELWKQIDKTLDINQNTIDKILNRGTRISDLVKQTEKNIYLSNDFYKQSKTMNSYNLYDINYVFLTLLLFLSIIMYILYFVKKDTYNNEEVHNADYITAFACLSLVYFVYLAVIAFTHGIPKKMIILICIIYLILIVVLLVKLNEHWKEMFYKNIPVDEQKKKEHLGILIFLIIHIILFSVFLFMK